ncbi:MAG: glyoxalase [Acidimicrobiales bacterium]|nr:glyoxalase [Hyphomonadaceae bacterium]RZV40757.1 MAG: glyoxalase [Acidimicrobiales bacterium]
MQIKKLDHVNIRTNQLGAMVEWYCDILGLRKGKRPDFSFGGAWLYAGDQAVVHLIEVEDAGAGSETDLKLEHFAFFAHGLSDFIAKLDRLDAPYRRSDLPDGSRVQVNIWDVDGNHIHVDFESNA